VVWESLQKPGTTHTYSGVQTNVTTPAIYNPKTVYTLLDYNVTKDEKNTSTITSDEKGEITSR